jgi:hypothetical protein
MNENEKVPQFWPGHVVHTGKANLTATATTELHRLFDLIADTSDAASEILKRAGRPPAGPDVERLRDIAARVDAMVDRVKAILR